ncbi:cupin-like domain-containing protein [Corallococcus sp. BB11-1]|uniref:cupin-like domain-containing protein n=1 Tax=Corallococcus sp. BB11-1 TaxID=2996783 RepID=UPI00226FF0E4|nr:cupin-like domain-containing protein [Corallococcus sp. BB11-1]MCY1033271.1 cupin-like domain-containing protein [Corallococcus sp. BB11-1]
MSAQVHFSESVTLPEDAVRQYNHIFMLRNLFQDPKLFRAEIRKLEQEVASQLPALQEDWREIDCFDAAKFDSAALQKWFREGMRPLVLRGFAREHACVRTWTPEYFLERYGDFRMWHSSTEHLFVEGALLSECIRNTLAGDKSRAYVENLSDIFNAFPELHDQIGLKQVGDYLGSAASYHKIAQLFIGGPGTGAAFHCANELNCFLNIYGQKKWTFVHPKYSFAMSSTIFNKGIFVGSLVKHNAPKRFLEAKQPLYNRVPKLQVVLEPGDMLINPPWWWHAVNNQGRASIAVASRWRILTEYLPQNPLFDFVQSFREERLTLDGKEMSESDVVVPDSELRKKYVTYEQMGWQDDEEQAS